MKIQILHDAAGNIRGLFAPTAGKRKGFLVPQGLDRIVTEVEIPEIDVELTQENQSRVIEALDKAIAGCTLVSGRLVRQKKGNY
jgi:hypothetical protein